MATSVKITALNPIGANIAYTTLVPVVNMSGTPTTEKATAQVLGNLILNGAGGSYFPAAAQSVLAQTVTNAAQPNITSVGTLTSLAVSGNINVGNANLGNLAVANYFSGDGGFLTNVSVAVTNVNSLVNGTSSVVVDNNSTVRTSVSGVANVLVVTSNSATLNGNLEVNGNISVDNVVSSGTQVKIVTSYDPNTGFGGTWIFGTGGALEWPSPPGVLWAIEPNINDEFEIKSTSNVVISTDIANANSSFRFDSDGIFTAPSNVNLLGTRLNVGSGSANLTGLSDPTLVIATNSNTYVQAAITNTDANGSADFATYGAGGDDTGGWSDIGFAGNAFSDANYTITNAGDGYVFVQGYANVVGGGSLVLATGSQGSTKDIVFATGGFLSSDEFGRISHANNALELTRANSAVVATVVTTTPVTVGALPLASTVGAGARAFVTDADSVTFNAPAVGGGSNSMPVFSNGTAWFIG